MMLEMYDVNWVRPENDQVVDGDWAEINESTEALIFCQLTDGTYGVKAGELAKNLAVLKIPATYNGKSVTQVLTQGFAGLSTLQTVIMPDTITTVGNRAFYDCIGIDTVTLSSNLVAIEEYAFYNCDMLKEITIPASTTFIGKWAFVNSGLTSIVFEDTTTGAEGWHFESKIKASYVYSSYSSTIEKFEIDLGAKVYTLPSPASSCTISLLLKDASKNAQYLTNDYKYGLSIGYASDDYMTLKMYGVNWVRSE
jgi:hypothetical protein